MARLARELPYASQLDPVGEPGSGYDAADFVGRLRARRLTDDEIRGRAEELSGAGAAADLQQDATSVSSVSALNARSEIAQTAPEAPDGGASSRRDAP